MRTNQQIVQTALSGYELLNDPLLNKGTAFTAAERDQFDLNGLLPPHVTTLDLQVFHQTVVQVAGNAGWVSNVALCVIQEQDANINLKLKRGRAAHARCGIGA